MTPTQQERRIQALYDDANVSRRYLCERVVHLESDMEELKEQLQDAKRMRRIAWDRVHEAERQIKKLLALGNEVD